MNGYFLKAKPIWAKDKIEEINCSLFFKTKLEQGTYQIRIAANNIYRIFLNGEMIAYGPARAAHNFYRVDTIEVNCQKKYNYLIIEVLSSRTNNFYTLNSEPFLQCEILKDKEVIKYTGKDFAIFNNDFKYRKVIRFSYQRPFTESYKIDKSLISFLTKGKSLPNKHKKKILKDKNFQDRNIDYPTYEKVLYKKIEYGKVKHDYSVKPYKDRCSYNEKLIIFKEEEYDINPNKEIASFVPYLTEKKSILSKDDFITFGNKVSLTGFININVTVKEDSVIYIYFDELDTKENKDDPIGIKYFRNTTYNFISYELKKGRYNLISFEPYTAKYIRAVVTSGIAKINYLGIIKYENPNRDALKYEFKDKKIQAVLDAAVNTFAHNAVDILTDCPSRERAGWLEDSFFSSKAEQYITGKNEIERNFLENYALYKKDVCPKNMVPCCYPSDFAEPLFIVQWSMWYLLELEDHVKRSGDFSIVKKSEENIRNLLQYYNEYSNSDELIEDLKGWRFIEWSKANDPEFVCGVNYPTNMLYYRTLISASTLLNDPSLKEKAERIKSKIIKQSFNGEFFIDNAIRDDKGNLKITDHITETCQYYAFFFEVADPIKFKNLFNKMRDKFGPTRDYERIYPNVYKSNVFPGDFLRLTILNKRSYFKLVLKETIEYFYKMAVKSGTLWEHDDIHASLNHAITSYIINMVFEANFGLNRIDKQTKTIYFNKVAAYKPSSVSIPLGNDEYLHLSTNGKEINIECPEDYKIVK